MLNALDQTGDRQAALARFVRSGSGAEARALRRALEALEPAGRPDPEGRADPAGPLEDAAG